MLVQSHNLDKNELNLLRACGAEGNNNDNSNENGNAAEEEPSPEAAAAATSNQAVLNALIDCIMELDQKGAFRALCSKEDHLEDFIRDFLKKNRVSTEPVRKVKGKETQTDYTLANSRITELVKVKDRMLQAGRPSPVMADGEMQTDAVEVAETNKQTVSTSKDNSKTANTNTSQQNDSDSDDLLDLSSDHHQNHSPNTPQKVKRRKLNLKKSKTSTTTGPIKATNRAKQPTKFASTTVTRHSTSSTSTSDQKPLIINRKEVLKPTRTDWAIKCPFCVDKRRELKEKKEKKRKEKENKKKKKEKGKKKNDDEETDEEEEEDGGDDGIDDDDNEEAAWASLMVTFTLPRDYMKHYIAVHQRSDPKSGKPLWKCFRCEQIFKTRDTFVAHVRQSECFNKEANVRRFQCPHCPVGFVEPFKRAQHLEYHIIANHPKLVVFPGEDHSDEGDGGKSGDESDEGDKGDEGGGKSNGFNGQKPSTSMAALTADSKKKQQQVYDLLDSDSEEEEEEVVEEEGKDSSSSSSSSSSPSSPAFAGKRGKLSSTSGRNSSTSHRKRSRIVSDDEEQESDSSPLTAKKSKTPERKENSSSTPSTSAAPAAAAAEVVMKSPPKTAAAAATVSSDEATAEETATTSDPASPSDTQQLPKVLTPPVKDFTAAPPPVIKATTIVSSSQATSSSSFSSSQTFQSAQSSPPRPQLSSSTVATAPPLTPVSTLRSLARKPNFVFVSEKVSGGGAAAAKRKVVAGVEVDGAVVEVAEVRRPPATRGSTSPGSGRSSPKRRPTLRGGGGLLNLGKSDSDERK